MTAEGPKAGLTHSRSLIVDASVIGPRCRPARPAHRHAAGAGDGVQGGFGRATCFDALKPFPKEGQETVGAMSISAMWQRRPWACG